MYINKENEDKYNKLLQTEIIKLPTNQQIVYDIILNNPWLRIPALSEICGLKESSINNVLFKLRKLKLVEFIGSSRDGGYYIKSKD